MPNAQCPMPNAHFQTEFQILNLHKVINTIINFLIILVSASTFMS
ncbi:hypothetical protein [Nostoc sp. CHAB 5715]|nr:hypothetical protein [Nostoc sp. CHAB 5715]